MFNPYKPLLLRLSCTCMTELFKKLGWVWMKFGMVAPYIKTVSCIPEYDLWAKVKVIDSECSLENLFLVMTICPFAYVFQLVWISIKNCLNQFSPNRILIKLGMIVSHIRSVGMALGKIIAHPKIMEKTTLFGQESMSWAMVVQFSLVVTYLAKEVMFFVALVFMFVCLSVCLWTTLLKKLRTDWNEIL